MFPLFPRSARPFSSHLSHRFCILTLSRQLAPPAPNNTTHHTARRPFCAAIIPYKYRRRRTSVPTEASVALSVPISLPRLGQLRPSQSVHPESSLAVPPYRASHGSFSFVLAPDAIETSCHARICAVDRDWRVGARHGRPHAERGPVPQRTPVLQLRHRGPPDHCVPGANARHTCVRRHLFASTILALSARRADQKSKLQGS